MDNNTIAVSWLLLVCQVRDRTVTVLLQVIGFLEEFTQRKTKITSKALVSSCHSTFRIVKEFAFNSRYYYIFNDVKEGNNLFYSTFVQ